MQIKSVLPWQVMPGNKIIHEIEGVVRVLKVVDQGGLF